MPIRIPQRRRIILHIAIQIQTLRIPEIRIRHGRRLRRPVRRHPSSQVRRIGPRPKVIYGRHYRLPARGNTRLVPQQQVQLFPFAEKSAFGLCLEDANRYQIFSRFQYTLMDEIDSRVLNSCARAELHPVNIRSIHALNRAEEQQSTTRGKWIRKDDLVAEPDDRRCLTDAQFGEAAGNINLLPIRIIESWRGPFSF
jgi:hypothetical protein